MSQINARTISKLEEVAAKIDGFPIGHFANDSTRALYLLELWRLTSELLAGIKLLSDEQLDAMVADLNTRPTEPLDALLLHAQLLGVVVALRNHLGNRTVPSRPFVDPTMIDVLRDTKISNLDLGKLIKMCEELNDNYERENYIACVLLLRAVMNHVPPVFGYQLFKEVSAHAGRSVKAALELLEDNARVISDLHNHSLIRATEPLPTRSQIEPFRASFEILLHEIVARGEASGSTVTRR